MEIRAGCCNGFRHFLCFKCTQEFEYDFLAGYRARRSANAASCLSSLFYFFFFFEKHASKINFVKMRACTVVNGFRIIPCFFIFSNSISVMQSLA